MAELQSHWARVHGSEIHARVARSPFTAAEPTVVLVHGLVFSSRYMRRLASRLGELFPVWAPDLPGFGLSSKPARSLEVPELADALAGWMEAVGIERAALVGSSFGCQIAVHTAARYPERVSHVVLQGPTMDAAARTVPRHLARFVANAVREPPSLAPTLIRDYIEAGWRRAAATFRIAVGDRIEANLARVEAPALVIAGERDPVVPMRWSRRVSRLLPRGRLEKVPDGTHTLVFTEPDKVASLVAWFVSERPRSFLAPRREPPFLASFDSASAMVRATGRSARNECVAELGIDGSRSPLLPAANQLPLAVRQRLYSIAGWSEAIPPERLGEADADALRAWVTSLYPARRYPAAFVGSANGAAAHLSAAMNAPWLPQTFLIPVRCLGSDPVDMVRRMEWGRRVAGPLLDANPGVQLHHMHDPNRDLLMSRHMSYFRIKLRHLGEDYEHFLRERLQPGATLYVLECNQRWPVTRVDGRHVFQAGAVGGLEPRDYHEAGPAVEAMLARQGIDRRRWRAPDPDAMAPEAEWGFEPAMRADIVRLARRCGHRVRRICFDAPDDLSGLVADLHRAWYAGAGMPTDRLLVESFILLEPLCARRLGAVPYWTSFPVERALAALERYLESAPAYRELALMLFSHGVRSAGLADIGAWERLGERVQEPLRWLGVDRRRFPADFAVLRRYHEALRRLDWRRWEPRHPLSPRRLDTFLSRYGDRYPVRCLDEVALQSA